MSLKGLVTVQTRIELKEIVRNGGPEVGQGLLKAKQVLPHAVDKRTFDEYTAGKTAFLLQLKETFLNRQGFMILSLIARVSEQLWLPRRFGGLSPLD
jgi:hypothetical protein